MVMCFHELPQIHIKCNLCEYDINRIYVCYIVTLSYVVLSVEHLSPIQLIK